MGRLAIFLDGGYIDASFPKDLNYTNLVDYITVQTKQELLRTYLYHCLPLVDPESSEDTLRRLDGKKRLFFALDHTPRFVVRLGRLVRRGDTFLQKGVDIQLGLDMAALAYRGAVTDIALVSGDGDFPPALEAVKELGVLTWVFYKEGTISVELLRAADEAVPLGNWYATQVGESNGGK